MRSKRVVITSPLFLSLAAAPPLLLDATTAGAQTAAAPGQPTIEQLESDLKQRDALIDDLLRRVQALEREVGTGPAQPAAPPAAAAPPAGAAAPQNAPAAAQNVPPPAAPQQPPGAAPGRFVVNPNAAQRALERALVESGALLLPVGSAEVDPAFQYNRLERSFPTFTTVGATTFASQAQVRQNQYTADATVRAGLPLDSQFDLDVPYRFLSQRAVNSIAGGPFSVSELDGSGLSDVNVTLDKQLLTEQDWHPSLIGSIEWSDATGATIHGVHLGNGYNQLHTIFTALKRVDPLAFVGSFGYVRGFEQDGFNVPNEYDVNMGAQIATSPETSLSFTVQQQFLDDFRIGGTKVPGSGETEATFLTGVSAIVAPRTLFNLTVGIGLTNDAPKYVIRAAFSIRFDNLWAP